MGLTIVPTRQLPAVPWPEYLPQIEHIWRPSLRNAIGVNGLTTNIDLVGTSTSVNTASVTTSSANLTLIAVESVDADLSSPQTPTITAGPITMVQITTGIFGSASFGRLTWFRGMGTGTGAFTIDFAGVQQLAIVWSVFEMTGTDTSGSNGSGAIVQSPAISTGSSTTPTATLAAFGSANNAGVGVAGCLDAGGGALGVGSGWTNIHSQAVGADGVLRTEWKLNDVSVAFTLATARNWGVLGLEIKAAVAGSTRPVKMAGEWGGFAGSSGGFAG